jgi:hypothetical protein
MRIIVIYRPNSENARVVEEYIADFNRFHPGAEMEVKNVDTIEGAEMSKLYGIMEYPALLAIKDDGQMQQLWMGVDKLPLMNDLAYYVNQV